ncbi:hypothetical protein SAMN05421677_11899 [Halobacillus aidingensis]|uniref:Uncharacterized protein n=1 Tax=Halobacillus aidingensis TaxID=240303 RepID=A0A1H0SMS0_HALAD|nr:hypothetical protein SAMN05421677_11899 [Halobacillus aidingensis]
MCRLSFSFSLNEYPKIVIIVPKSLINTPKVLKFSQKNIEGTPIKASNPLIND